MGGDENIMERSLHCLHLLRELEDRHGEQSNAIEATREIVREKMNAYLKEPDIDSFEWSFKRNESCEISSSEEERQIEATKRQEKRERIKQAAEAEQKRIKQAAEAEQKRIKQA